MALLLLPIEIEPILVPVISFYVGNLSRTILDIVFWCIWVRKDLPATAKDKVCNTFILMPINVQTAAIAAGNMWKFLAQKLIFYGCYD